MRILFLSTPVGPLGTGLAGGVEALISSLGEGLVRRGHAVTVIAPEGSRCQGLPVLEVSGRGTPNALSDRRTSSSLSSDSVLSRMWEMAKQVEGEQDLILNFGFDWLPYYLGSFFRTPVLHFATLAAPSSDLGPYIAEVARRRPLTVAVHSRAQAESFGPSEFFAHLSYGLDLRRYQFNPGSENVLGWAGRLSPEKGLEDAFAVAERTGIPLRIMGVEQDPDYFAEVRRRFRGVKHEYLGLLPQRALQQELGKCRAFLMTSKFVEAMGVVVLEAMACGVPVVSYNRGGPAETVIDGLTGFLVEPDSVEAMAQAVTDIPGLDRRASRILIEKRYSVSAFLDRAEAWLTAHPSPRSERIQRPAIFG